MGAGPLLFFSNEAQQGEQCLKLKTFRSFLLHTAGGFCDSLVTSLFVQMQQWNVLSALNELVEYTEKVKGKLLRTWAKEKTVVAYPTLLSCHR